MLFSEVKLQVESGVCLLGDRRGSPGVLQIVIACVRRIHRGLSARFLIRINVPMWKHRHLILLVDVIFVDLGVSRSFGELNYTWCCEFDGVVCVAEEC